MNVYVYVCVCVCDQGVMEEFDDGKGGMQRIHDGVTQMRTNVLNASGCAGKICMYMRMRMCVCVYIHQSTYIHA